MAAHARMKKFTGDEKYRNLMTWLKLLMFSLKKDIFQLNGRTVLLSLYIKGGYIEIEWKIIGA